MNERNKKKLIALLLLVSCLISAWLLFITPTNDARQLRDFAQADSLLRLTLSDFNIADAQISSASIRVDSTFTRKTYTVWVPPAFSKTQLHAALQQRLSPYKIELPAHITFPEKDMAIHFYYKNNIARTVNLVTDKELKISQSFAHLIIAFEGRPTAYLLETLTSLGEPIPIAIIIRPPLQLPEWWGDFKEQHPNLIIWPQTDTGNNLLTADQEQISSALEPIIESSADATLLHFFENQQTARASLRGTQLSYIHARNAFILNPEAGRAGFQQTFRAFVRQARSGDIPLAIIIGTEESLRWIQQELNTFKKGGLMITPPHTVNF